jgi:tetratricopeptide (TPR) repeat protein
MAQQMQLPESRYRFSARKERRSSLRLPILLAALVASAALGVGAYFLFFSTTSPQNSDRETPFTADTGETGPVEITDNGNLDVLELWNRKEYAKVNEICEARLAEEPLEPKYLALNGFAYFYRGTSLYTLEDQIPLYDMAVRNLRKVLIREAPPMEAEVHYILGKTYYHKGRFHVDQAVRHLEKSVELGYVGEDTYRYLGLAYSEMGDYARGVENFLIAAEQTPDALLYLTIGQSYYKLKNIDKALDFLMRAVHSTEEAAIEKKSRFLIGSIYIEREDFVKARDQYEKILSLDQESADAHYYLGEIYDKMGDQVKARAEWRKALNIDPSHYGALLKLY